MCYFLLIKQRHQPPIWIDGSHPSHKNGESLGTVCAPQKLLSKWGPVGISAATLHKWQVWILQTWHAAGAGWPWHDLTLHNNRVITRKQGVNCESTTMRTLTLDKHLSLEAKKWGVEPGNYPQRDSAAAKGASKPIEKAKCVQDVYNWSSTWRCSTIIDTYWCSLR